jgi:RNA polymerase sigma factor (sigma-70 family)
VGARFPTTHWSRVLAARDGTDSEARLALETLCQTYWHPLFVFVRCQGHDEDEARDLVQAYFTELLEKGFLKGVEPGLGRFRSFLLASLKHFLSHERDRTRALKRGGEAKTISLDAASTAGLEFQAVDDLTPDQVFERHWALTVLERALARLRQAARESHSEDQLEALKPYLTGESGRTYAEVAERLGMSEGAVRAAVVRLRKRFGQALRAEISQTVSDPSEVDDEIRRMLSVIRPFQRAGA